MRFTYQYKNMGTKLFMYYTDSMYILLRIWRTKYYDKGDQDMKLCAMTYCTGLQRLHPVIKIAVVNMGKKWICILIQEGNATVFSPSYFFFYSLHSRLVSLSVSINLRDVCGPSQVHGNHGKMISNLELTFPIFVMSWIIARGESPKSSNQFHQNIIKARDSPFCQS